MSDYEYTFTVFTPSYNRGHLLHRVYESLHAQTFQDFEWLIVDDGSTDDTEERVEEWKEEASFPIQYFYQENQGKHVAMNRGVERARGRFFLTLDSDDRCMPEALERLKHHWEEIPDEEKSKFSAVTALCEDEGGQVVGDLFPQDVFDSTPQELRYRYGVEGEQWGFQRTDVMKEFPFPEVEAMYVPEGHVWRAIGRHYKTRFVNETLRIFCDDSEEGEESITKGPIDPDRYARGNICAALSEINQDIDWFWVSPGPFFIAAVLYVRFSLHLGKSWRKQVGLFNNAIAIGIWGIALPFGIALYLRDQYRS